MKKFYVICCIAWLSNLAIILSASTIGYLKVIAIITLGIFIVFTIVITRRQQALMTENVENENKARVAKNTLALLYKLFVVGKDPEPQDDFSIIHDEYELYGNFPEIKDALCKYYGNVLSKQGDEKMFATFTYYYEAITRSFINTHLDLRLRAHAILISIIHECKNWEGAFFSYALTTEAVDEYEPSAYNFIKDATHEDFDRKLIAWLSQVKKDQSIGPKKYEQARINVEYLLQKKINV